MTSTMYMTEESRKRIIVNCSEIAPFSVISVIGQIFLRYSNEDVKIYQYPRLHIKIIYRRFLIVTRLTSLNIRIRDL